MRSKTLLGALLRLHLVVVASTCVLLVAATMLSAAYILRSDQEWALESLAESVCRGIELEREEEGAPYPKAAELFMDEFSVAGIRAELFARDGVLMLGQGHLPGWQDDGGAQVSSQACGTRTVAGKDHGWARYRFCTMQCDADHSVRMIARDTFDQRDVRRAAAVLLLVLPIAVLAGALAGRTALARLLQPLQALRDSVTGMAARPGLSLGVGATLAELATLEQAFDNLLRRLGEVIEGEKRFTQEASHELRTPLTVLRGRLEHLVVRLRAQPALKDEADRALHDLDAIDRLIGALLVLARSDSATIPLQPVNLCDLAREVARAQACSDGDGSPPPEVDAPDEILVNGSEELLARALANVVENARKHGGDGARIRIRVMQNGRRGVMIVDDSGPGIAAELRPNVFDRFSRSPSARRTVPGSGLGLAVVRAIVLRHGGEIETGPSELGGEAIRITVPLLTDLESQV